MSNKIKIVTDPDSYLVDIKRYCIHPGEVPWWKIRGLKNRAKARNRQRARIHGDHAKLHYRKLKLDVVALFGSRCAQCGERDYRVLQINHVNGNGKEDREIYSNSYALYKAILSGERSTDDLNLLCANCNIIHEHVLGRRGYLSNRRIKIIRMLGNRCGGCGETNPLVLQINHTVGNMRSDLVKYGGPDNLYRAIVSGDRPTTGINLLCANCNIRYEYEVGRRKQYLDESLVLV